MRLNFSIALLLLCFVVNAQQDTLPSVEMKSVTIVRKIIHDGQFVSVHDSSDLAQAQAQNLGQYLARNESVNVRSNGAAGAASSISIRGGSSNHTSVLWNGFALNSMSLGGMDASLIPMTFFDRLTVVPNGSSNLFKGGSFGGGIVLGENKFNKGLNVKLSTENRSFGGQQYAGKVSWSNGKFWLRSISSYQRNENDFPFVNTAVLGQPVDTLKHGGFWAYNYLNGVGFKTGNHRLVIDTWVTKKKKKLPSGMSSSVPSFQEQGDSTTKVILNYRNLSDIGLFEVKSAFIDDRLRFTDWDNQQMEFSIDSRINSKRSLNELSWSKSYKSFWFYAGGQYNWFKVDNVNYERGTEEELRQLLYGGIKYSHDRISGSVAVNQHLMKDVNPKPAASLSFAYRLFHGFRMLATINSHYMIPTFNQKYWVPGGNRELKPEEGYASDLGFSFRRSYSFGSGSFLNIDLRSTAFYTRINNWIQWVPLGAYWGPISFKQVTNKGIQSRLNLKYKRNEIGLRLTAGYSLTYSTNTAVTNEVDSNILNKQSIYVPLHTANTLLSFSYKSWYLNANGKLESRKYFTADNDEIWSLDPYALVDVAIGKSIRLKESRFNLELAIENIADQSYQLISDYAMPGRMYVLKFNYLLNHKLTNNYEN